MMPETCGLIATSLRGTTEPVATVFLTIDAMEGDSVLKTTGGRWDLCQR